MILSDLEWLSKIFNDTKRRALLVCDADRDLLAKTKFLVKQIVLLLFWYSYTEHTIRRSSLCLNLLCPRPVGGALSGDRRPSSVRLSVCLSDVAYIGSNSKNKRPRKTKLCIGVPQVTCDSHTDFKVKRSKVKVTGRRHIVASTKRAANWRTAADITSLKYYLILQCL